MPSRGDVPRIPEGGPWLIEAIAGCTVCRGSPGSWWWRWRAAARPRPTRRRTRFAGWVRTCGWRPPFNRSTPPRTCSGGSRTRPSPGWAPTGSTACPGWAGRSSRPSAAPSTAPAPSSAPYYSPRRGLLGHQRAGAGRRRGGQRQDRRPPVGQRRRRNRQLHVVDISGTQPVRDRHGDAPRGLRRLAPAPAGRPRPGHDLGVVPWRSPSALRPGRSPARGAPAAPADRSPGWCWST